MISQKKRFDFLWRSISTVGPLGLSRWAPGTFGAVPAVPIAWLMRDQSSMVAICMILFLTGIGTFAVAQYIRNHKNKDPDEVVIDEFVGCLIACSMVAENGIGWLISAFVAFRFFDIVKPWPISWIDRNVTGSAGVMGDDVLAGLCAGGILRMTAYGLDIFQ